jgi:hypothetical protein
MTGTLENIAALAVVTLIICGGAVALTKPAAAVSPEAEIPFLGCECPSGDFDVHRRWRPRGLADYASASSIQTGVWSEGFSMARGSFDTPLAISRSAAWGDSSR